VIQHHLHKLISIYYIYSTLTGQRDYMSFFLSEENSCYL